MTDAERQRLTAVVAELRRREQSRFRQFFTDDGPTARSLYPKHLDFFRAGGQYKERLFMARTG